MSGGSLDYTYNQVYTVADKILKLSTKQLHHTFANHLVKVAAALHDLEWELSDDYGEGEADNAILECIDESDVLDHLIHDAQEIKRELDTIMNRVYDKVTPTLYDWRNVPEWVQYLATDADGITYGYANIPWVSDEFSNWDYGGSTCAEEMEDMSGILSLVDWKQSLEKRPEGR